MEFTVAKAIEKFSGILQVQHTMTMITNIAYNSVTLACTEWRPINVDDVHGRMDGRTDRWDRGGPVDPVARSVAKVRPGTRLSAALRPFCSVKKYLLRNSGATVANTRPVTTRGLFVCTIITISM